MLEVESLGNVGTTRYYCNCYNGCYYCSGEYADTLKDISLTIKIEFGRGSSNSIKKRIVEQITSCDAFGMGDYICLPEYQFRVVYHYDGEEIVLATLTCQVFGDVECLIEDMNYLLLGYNPPLIGWAGYMVYHRGDGEVVEVVEVEIPDKEKNRYVV